MADKTNKLELVFFLEEESAQAMLEGLLPRIFSADIISRVKYRVFRDQSRFSGKVPRGGQK